MKYLFGLLLAFSNFANAAALATDENLPIIDTFMGNRRTNIGTHDSLYPGLNLGLAVNCHPYDPTTVAGSDIPACASHPLIVNYVQEQSRKFLPESLQKIFDLLDASTKVHLNVQDNPWNGTQVEIRAHAYSDFFPNMGTNYQRVNVSLYRDDGTTMNKMTSSVHLHDGIASPDNFGIVGLNRKINESFFSVVTYDGKSIFTRHILLTVETREQFQNVFCSKTEDSRSPSFFGPLLSDQYAKFLESFGVM